MFVNSNHLNQLLPYYHLELGEKYEATEIDQLFFLMAFFIFGLEKIEVRTKEILLSESELLTQRDIVKRLYTGEPLQYILGKAEFYDIVLKVSPDVLIPRPETAELIDLILSKHTSQQLKIIDIGTGSGCIPLAIKANKPNWLLTGVDVSRKALNIAKNNAQALDLEVDWIEQNILTKALPSSNKFDIIISNPPYVLESDKSEMHHNVLNFEPFLALFVPNESPLLFYDRIIALAKKALNSNGMLYFEIHEKYGIEVKKNMENSGFHKCEIIKDLQGKDRFVSGQIM